MKKGGEVTGGNAYLALYPAQFLLAVEHAVDLLTVLIHIIPLPRACTRTHARSLREVLRVPTLVLRYPFFPLRTNLIRQIIVCVYADIRRHPLKNAHQGPHAPALAGTSCRHRVSSLAFPFHPWDWIHLARTKRSHLDGGFGFG